MATSTNNNNASNTTEATSLIVTSRQRGKSQDEKIEAQAKKKFKANQSQFAMFLKKAQIDKEFWASEYCKELREFCRHVDRNQSSFPMPLQDNPLGDPEAIVDKLPALDNFIEKLKNSSISSESNALEIMNPVLRIFSKPKIRLRKRLYTQ